MILPVILLLICGNALASGKHCHCDLIEFNTIATSEFRQVIFWRWNSQYSRYEARGWVFADNVDQIDLQRVRVNGWIVSGNIRFTRTDYDPERHNLHLCPDTARVPWCK